MKRASPHVCAALALAACATQACERDAAGADPADAALDQPLDARVPVVHAALWEPVDAAGDPFLDRPPQAECERAGFGEELLGGTLGFFVRSDSCPYLTARQASRIAIPAGAQLEFRLFLFPLTAPTPASAHLAIQLGDTVAWERAIPIPDPGGQLLELWNAPAEVPLGTPVFFHVHNHGSNEYILSAIDLVGARP